MRRTLLCVLLGVTSLMATLVFLPAQQAERPGRRYALLIGVQRYDGTGLQNLKFCENDVTQLAEVLRGEGYGYKRVVLLTRTEAQKNIDRDGILPTAENIRDHLKGLLSDLRPEDTVMLAFAGHGVQAKKDGKMYFCPSKCNLDKLESLISLDAIYAQLKECKANEKILLVDACRNDPLDKRGEDDRLESLTRPLLPDPPGGTVAMFSCSKGQTARENPKHEHGYLFKYVIAGLKGDRQVVNAKTGEVSWLKLAAFVTDEVKDVVKEDYGPKTEQVPEIKGEVRGLILGKAIGAAGHDMVSKTLPSLKLVRIPARGKRFTMGSSEREQDYVKNTNFYKENLKDLEYEKAHEVTLTKDYYLGVTEVTRGQFRKFVKDTEYKTEAEADGRGGFGFDLDQRSMMAMNPKYTWKFTGFYQDDDHPVVNVSWNDAVAFCKWLSEKDGKEYRLPTEAEWEFACRAGTTSVFYFGDDLNKMGEYANVADKSLKAKWNYSNLANKEFQNWVSWWFDRVSWDDSYPFTAPVGQFKPNGYGLYDMHGNAAEWCSDWHGKYPSEMVTDPVGPEKGSRRVERGGSWFYYPLVCRSASHGGTAPVNRTYSLGFRIAALVR